MTTLQPILQALGYGSEAQQRDFIKLIAASGVFGALPDVNGALNDRQADAVLAGVDFRDATEAAEWLHDKTQEHIPMAAITRQIDAGFPQLLEKIRNEPLQEQKPIMLDPAEIKVDAPTYQYRSGGDANGVTEKRHVEPDHWDPKLSHSPLLVHRCIEQDADGAPKDVYYLVDGHHRRDTAVALNAKGVGPGKLPAVVLGPEFSKTDAMVAGVCKNMMHGRHDAVDIVDAAKAFQAPFDVEKLSPYLKLQGDVKLAYDMRGLSDESFNLVASGAVPLKAAAEVTERLEEPAQQDAALLRLSADLRRNYADYLKSPSQSWTAAVGRKPKPAPAANADRMPGFEAKLQEQRSAAAAGIGLT